MAYYVTRLDKRTNRELDESRIEFDSAVEAHEGMAFLEELYPDQSFLYGYVPTEAERDAFTHVCGNCDCHFDRHRRLISR